MATEKYLQGECNVSGTTSWTGDCEHFEMKHRLPYHCPKVCGNCEYFTVMEFEIYPEQIAGEGTAIGRVA